MVCQFHGTPSRSDRNGMPSTLASIGIRYSPAAASSGAIVKPQLPANTVVTPCSGDGLRSGSQNACASRWVCKSTKPATRFAPSASMTRRRPSRRRRRWLRCDHRATPTSACRRSTSGTVDDVTVADDEVEHGSLLATHSLDAEPLQAVALDRVAAHEQVRLALVQSGFVDEALKHVFEFGQVESPCG